MSVNLPDVILKNKTGISSSNATSKSKGFISRHVSSLSQQITPTNKEVYHDPKKSNFYNIINKLVNKNVSDEKMEDRKKGKINFNFILVNSLSVDKELNPDNFFKYNRDTVKEDDEKADQQRELNELKKLQEWDMNHASNSVNEEKLINIIKRKSMNKSQILNSELESINSVNFIKENLAKLSAKFKTSNKKIQEFANKTQQEQTIILLQNIAFTKRKYNFDVFDIKDIRALESELPICIKEVRDAIIDTDKYREVIKEKSKIENIYRKNMMDLTKNIIEKKIQKKKLEGINAELISEISNMRREYEKRRDLIDLDRANIEKQCNLPTPKNAHKMDHNKLLNIFSNISSVTAITRRSVRLKSEDEDRIRLVVELNKKLEQNDKELAELVESYEKIKVKFDKIIEDNKQAISLVEAELKYLKNKFNLSSKDQKSYYLEILSKGVDVRSEGLSWVIRRLIELDVFLDNSMFPKFMDHKHIDYLLKLSSLQIESNQMKIILKTLKSRQKNIRNKSSSDFLMRASQMSFKSNNRNSNTSNLNFERTGSSFYGFMLGNEVNPGVGLGSKLMNHFDTVFKKYEKYSSSTFDQKLEDSQINSIVNTLKKQLIRKDEVTDEDDKMFNSIMKYFNENEQQKEVFEDILGLRSKIQHFEEQIEKLISEELNNFKKKYDSHRSVSASSSLQYDMIYAVLFGNNITV